MKRFLASCMLLVHASSSRAQSDPEVELRLPRGLAALQLPRPPSERPFLVDRSSSVLPNGYPMLGAASVAAGRLSKDPYADLVLGTPNGVLVWVHDGGGAFADQTAQRLQHPGTAVGALALADLDGDLDLYTAGGPPANGVPDRLWFNQGGVFGAWQDFPFHDEATSSIAAGDVDGDGDVDLVLGIGCDGHAQGAGRDQLYRNDGAGAFHADPDFASAAWNQGSTPTTAARLGDLDGDGDLDLFLARADSGAFDGGPGARNDLLLNDGRGHFTDVSDAAFLDPRFEDNSFGARLVDLEGDGDLDVVVANSLLAVPGASSGDVLVNQGRAQGGAQGTFRDVFGALPETPPLPEAIRLGVLCGDLDLDGRADAFVTVHDLPPGGDQPLFLGRASGILERADGFETGTFIGGGAALFDFENDGDLDLFVTAGGSAAGGHDALRARFYLNGTL